jgi:hypothetical protein
MNTTGVLQRTAAVLVGGAAAIHLGVAGVHLGESWPLGVSFLVLAAFQAVWMLRCWQPVHSGWLVAGAIVNAGVVALWALSRTVGLPVGPDPGQSEAVGFADLTASAFEGLAVGVTVLLLVRDRRRFAARPVGRRTATAVVAGVAAVVMTMGGVAIAAPGGGHGPASAAGSHQHGADQGGHEHGNGDAHDLPQLPDVSRATTEQTDAARDLLARTIAATARYRDPKAATAAGFDVEKAEEKWARKHRKADPKAPIRALHVPSRANRQDERRVDPAAPETLIYRRTTAGELHLVGVMFTAQGEEPPASYQPYLRWHYHQQCFTAENEKRPMKDDTCPDGTEQRRSGYMTHIWFVRPDDLVHAYAAKAPTPQLDAYLATVK